MKKIIAPAETVHVYKPTNYMFLVHTPTRRNFRFFRLFLNFFVFYARENTEQRKRQEGNLMKFFSEKIQ